MKLINILFILGIVKEALFAEANGQEVVITSPKALQDSISTKDTFVASSMTVRDGLFTNTTVITLFEERPKLVCKLHNLRTPRYSIRQDLQHDKQ